MNKENIESLIKEILEKIDISATTEELNNVRVE